LSDWGRKVRLDTEPDSPMAQGHRGLVFNWSRWF